MKTHHVPTDPVRIEPTHRVVSVRGTVVSVHDSLADACSMRDGMSKQQKVSAALKDLRVQERHEDGWRDVEDAP